MRYRASMRDCEAWPLKPRCWSEMLQRARSPAQSMKVARDLARNIAKTEATRSSRPQRKKVEMLFARPGERINGVAAHEGSPIRKADIETPTMPARRSRPRSPPRTAFGPLPDFGAHRYQCNYCCRASVPLAPAADSLLAFPEIVAWALCLCSRPRAWPNLSPRVSPMRLEQHREDAILRLGSFAGCLVPTCTPTRDLRGDARAIRASPSGSGHEIGKERGHGGISER